MGPQYFPILLVVMSTLFYHICQKSTPVALNPIVALFITYVCASIVSIIAFFIFVPKTSLFESLGDANWASFVLGFAVVGVELGFLLSYRAGWNISAASLVSNSSAALLLIPVGLLFYRERISITNISGVLLCITGLILVSKR